MNRLSITICAVVMITLVIVLILLFFKSISLPCLHGRDNSLCGGNSQSNGGLNGVSVTSYGTDSATSSSSTAFGRDGCTICLGDYCAREGVVVLPRCKHMFHKECIEQWVPAKSSRCPVCREPVIERMVGAAVSGHTLPLNLISNNIMLYQMGLN